MTARRHIQGRRDPAGASPAILRVLGAVVVVGLFGFVAVATTGVFRQPLGAPTRGGANPDARGQSATTTSMASTAATPTPTAHRVTPTGSLVVVIDAGHQAKQDTSEEPEGPGSSTLRHKVEYGAVGVLPPHIKESVINLAVALKLEAALEAQGVGVVMVRTTENVNIANSARAQIANTAHAALFVRIHCDGENKMHVAHGISTLVPAKNRWTASIVGESAKAGHLVHRAVIAATGAADKGVVSRSDLRGFNWSKVPSVLVEMGFMSNRAEDLKLGSSDYQQQLADGLAQGIVEYLDTLSGSTR